MKSNDDKASPSFRPFRIGDATHKCLAMRTWLTTAPVYMKTIAVL